MDRLLQLITTVALYLALATMMSQCVGAAYLWSVGALNHEKLRQIGAIIAGVKMIPAEMAQESPDHDVHTQQVSYEEVLQRRATATLDLDLREQAVQKGLADLRSLAAKLSEDARRFDIRREAFNARLKQTEEGAKRTAITEVRRTIEAMRPRQAKDQLIRMLEDDEMQAVVTMIKAMPLDKRKKLLAEFKEGDEPERLAEILKQILLGVPETTVIQQAQQEMSEP